MKSTAISNRKDRLIITLRKSEYDEEYLLTLIKRLQIEEIAKRADFQQSVIGLADEINQEWWHENGQKFLESIEK